jgi:hypothetical protein
MMISDCLDEIARASKGGDAGRPKLELSPAERALVERHWRSGEHATNQVAVDVIRAAARKARMSQLLRLRSVQAFNNKFGPSGRLRIKPKL